METLRISSTQFQRQFGLYQDIALTQAVTVTRDGRDRTVMISAEEYARLKRRDREVIARGDLSASDIAAIRGSEPPAWTAQFDPEVK